MDLQSIGDDKCVRDVFCVVLVIRMAGTSVKQGKKTNEEIQAENIKKTWDPLIDGVKWIEKYAQPLDKFFEALPDFFKTFIATLAVLTFGATLRGEWVVILVAALKHLGGDRQSANETGSVLDLFTEKKMNLEYFTFMFVITHIISFVMYFLIGGFLHWYYYVNRRHLSKEWKCQPDKWLSPELERHEILVGIVSLFVTGSFSAFLACYIYNGNPSTVYYQFDEYGWLWFFLQFPAIFIYSDYTTYILHRLYHTPFLYKHFHKLHHKYKTPTAFSVTAIHPVEILHIQLTSCLPLFVVPVHWVPFYSIAIYFFYHGILTHTGVNFKAHWWQPWQPDVDFHDKHHEFFHVNFGFNMFIWDVIHGTMREHDKVYTEDTYHGQAPSVDSEEGKSLIEKDPELQEAYNKIKTN